MRSAFKFLIPSFVVVMSFARPAMAAEASIKCYYWPVAASWHPQLQVALLEDVGLMPCMELVNEVIKDCESGPAKEMVSCIQKIKPLDQRISSDPYFQQVLGGDRELQEFFQNHDDYKEDLKHVKLARLFKGPSATSEGYTIGQHTERVLDVYEKQKKFYNIDHMAFPSYVKNRDRFMKYLLLYHDIGKSISATVFHNNSHEIEYSYPLAWRLMVNSNFSNDEANLAIGLIYRHKVIGDYLKGEITDVQSVVSMIQETARNTKTTVPEFFDLLHLLYVADAGSYPGLGRMVFGTSESEVAIQKMEIGGRDTEPYDALKAALGVN